MINTKENIIYLYKRELVTTFFVFLFILFFSNNFAFSATEEELRNQIQKVTETKVQLEQEISNYEKELKQIGDETVSLKNTIKALDATINKNSLDIKLTQNNIDKVTLEIEELSLNIVKGANTINKNTRAIASLLRESNTYTESSLIENLLTYKNLSDFWNEQQNIAIIQNEIREKTVEIKNEKIVLENNKTKTEKKKRDLLNLKFSLLDKKKILDLTKKEKNQLLIETKNSESNYKKILADKRALVEAFDKELLQFESQLKFSIDRNSFPSTGKGILSWPLDNVRITQRFGMTEFARTTNYYNGRGHNGVDFGASMGTDVKAALSGVIKGAGDTDMTCPNASFGKWVLIEHANGLSTIYAHLSLIRVSAGQIVTTGDVIGYSGNTGYSTGPHLHFGVYATQGVKIMSRKSVSAACSGRTYVMPIADLRAYLDPLQYL